MSFFFTQNFLRQAKDQAANFLTTFKHADFLASQLTLVKRPRRNVSPGSSFQRLLGYLPEAGPPSFSACARIAPTQATRQSSPIAGPGCSSVSFCLKCWRIHDHNNDTGQILCRRWNRFGDSARNMFHRFRPQLVFLKRCQQTRTSQRACTWFHLGVSLFRGPPK